MHSRRDFLIGTGTTALVASVMNARAQSTYGHVDGATAITQVFGDGQKLTAVALEYDRAIDTSSLLPSTFSVEGRTVSRIYANAEAVPAAHGTNGKFVIIELSPDDPDAGLYVQQGRTFTRKEAKASVIQTAPVSTIDGQIYAASGNTIVSGTLRNEIVDDFRQLEYVDPQTGLTIEYNLFVPKDYDAAKSYPLVLFMHDAGATSDIVTTTLVQGLGAVSWASPEDQAKRPAFVLAPQYDVPVVNDQAQATGHLDATVNLVNKLAEEYSIDRGRLYATGQSGGCMMSIAMNIKYPDLFAASFLVAGQWDAALVKPLAADKLWIIVSEGDLKAYPGQNAITAELERQGGTVSRAIWDGSWSPQEFNSAFANIDAKRSSINYVALRKGTVVPAGQKDDGGSNHINTWRIAYTIEGVREWIFRQHR